MGYYILEIEGKGRAEAEAEALELLGAKKDELEFEAIGQTSGLMRLVKRDAGVVRALPKDETSFEVHARGVLLTIVRKMGIDAWIQQTGEREDNYYIELGSKDTGYLIGKHGRTLDAIQFLVNLIVNTRTKSGRRIMVDVEAYRERRQKSLTRLAQRMADRVARTGRPVLLNYMNPYERRIIHLTLEKDDRVYTESDGNGVYKRVRVIPVERKKNGGAAPAGEKRSRNGGGRGASGRARDDESRFNRAPATEAEEPIDENIGNRVHVEEEEELADDDIGNRR
jgi:spoIIIJ-associated protein